MIDDKKLQIIAFVAGIIQSTALQSQQLVKAYFSMRQLLPFCFTNQAG